MMKKLLIPLAFVLFATTSFAQYVQGINSGANLAYKLPYFAITDPVNDNFIYGHPIISKKTINFNTFVLEAAGVDRYPIDVNGNISDIFQSTATDTIFWIDLLEAEILQLSQD